MGSLSVNIKLSTNQTMNCGAWPARAANYLPTFWSNGGNWLVFFILWFITSGIMVSLEQSQANVYITKEIINKQEVDLIVKLLKEQKAHLQDKTELGNQMGKVIQLLETDPNIPKVYGKMNLEIAMVQQNMINVIVEVFKSELERIKSDLDKDDIQSSHAASQLLGLLSDNKTLEAFSVSGKASVTEYLSTWNNGSDYCEEFDCQGWGLEDGIHFTSSIFTNIGYGARTPIPTAGKFMTIFLILFQVPFYLHCLASLAEKINRILDRIYSHSVLLDDDENVIIENSTSKTKTLVLIRGCLVLLLILFGLFLVSTIYHYCTMDWSFTDLLYFEFVRLSAIGFGDILPKDEMTLGGAILKNLFLHIPNQIILFTLFVRILPFLY